MNSSAQTFPLTEWKTASVDAESSALLARELSVPMPVAKVLVSRGYGSPAAAQDFLNPQLSKLGDPFSLPGMEVAVARTWSAIEQGSSILVYGDYDVDGVCSTALVVSVLRELGARVSPFLPHRMNDGYGLSTDTLRRCLDTYHPGLIITVDCGTGSNEAVKMAQNEGVDVIVTDHHEAEGEPAEALALVNPKFGADDLSRTLAGAGVAFKFCHALVKQGMQANREEANRIDLRTFMDLVAIATVADVVPLVGENRILVRHGLARLNQAPRPGISALLEIAGLERDVEATHIGFVIGPRLNAAGRLGGANAALELLLSDDHGESRQWANELDAANRERREIEDRIFKDASAEIDANFDAERTFGVVVGKEGWHVGTIGIVAARLCTRFYRPSIVIGFNEDGKGRGSCRSIDRVDILEVLRDCDDLLITYGGHKMAAGLELELRQYESFRERFNTACASRLEDVPMVPVQHVDAWIRMGEADQMLVDALDSLRPLGAGNPTPIWGVRNVRLAAPPKRVGRENQHLKMTVAKGGSQLEAIGFNLGPIKPPAGDIDMVFQLNENTFRGRTMLQMNVKDLRPSSDSGYVLDSN